MTEAVYERILTRVDRDELGAKCNKILKKEAKRAGRRLSAATSALQGVYDVHAATRQLHHLLSSTQLVMDPTTPGQRQLLQEIADLHERLCTVLKRVQPSEKSVIAAVVDRSCEQSKRATTCEDGVVVTTAPSSLPLRRGKWTKAEITYCDRLVDEFNAGRLSLAEGTPLRVYVGAQLGCPPARVYKKFHSMGKGQCISRISYKPSDKELPIEELQVIERDLAALREAFLASCPVDSSEAHDNSTDEEAPAVFDTDSDEDDTIMVIAGKTPSTTSPATPVKGKKRRLSASSCSSESPLKPRKPCPVGLEDEHHADDDALGRPPAGKGPHHDLDSDDDSAGSGSPIHLDVLDSETESDTPEPTYLDTARFLRLQPDENKVKRLPGLMRQLQYESGCPESQQGTGFVALVSSFLLVMEITLSLPSQEVRTLLPSVMGFVACLEGFSTEGSTVQSTFECAIAAFRAQIEDIQNSMSPTDIDDRIRGLLVELQAQVEGEEHTRSLEAIDPLVRLMDDVFDYGKSSWTEQRGKLVSECIDFLLEYAGEIPQNTRRKQQRIQRLEEQRAELDVYERVDV